MPKNITPADSVDIDTTATPEWPKSFEWSGITFTIDDPEDWPIGALRAFEVGHQIDAIARVIGDATFARVADMSARRTRELFDKIAETAGFASAGE